MSLAYAIRTVSESNTPLLHHSNFSPDVPRQEFAGALAGELAGFRVESVGAAGIVKAMLGSGDTC